MNESRELARFVAELKYSHLTVDVVAKVKDLILDHVGIMMGCSTLPWSKMIYEYVRTWGTEVGESTIVNYGNRVKAENAVFANSSFAHGFEIDDIYLPGMSHPGCIVVPSALAMGERESISGRDLIVAVAAGYEVMGRINKAIVPSSIMRGFHAPTSVSGPLAAAAVAGKILGFGPDMLLNALSIAGSHASGLTEYSHGGGSVKRMHAGMAAHGGLRSALIAEIGITGPATILEGQHGFCHAFADEYRLSEITDNLGKDFRVVMGTSFKAYCACAGMHSAIDATLKLTAQHDIRGEEVASITMGTNRQSIGHCSAPITDIASAQFSAAFGLSLALIRGSNGFRDYTQETLRDPQILALASKVKLEVDSEVDSEFPATRAARVTIRLRNGVTYQEKVDYCKGTPQNPLTRAEFESKFRGLASAVSNADKLDEIISIVSRLEQLEDLSGLVSLLS
jgi:2-methylcitrate dehydratase PrpD